VVVDGSGARHGFAAAEQRAACGRPGVVEKKKKTQQDQDLQMPASRLVSLICGAVEGGYRKLRSGFQSVADLLDLSLVWRTFCVQRSNQGFCKC